LTSSGRKLPFQPKSCKEKVKTYMDAPYLSTKRSLNRAENTINFLLHRYHHLAYKQETGCADIYTRSV